jgi:diaminopimelate decarboxylase
VDSVAALLGRHFPSSGAELVVGGLPISAAIAGFETPLYVYDGGVLYRQYRALRSALPARFSIAYSVKANPNRALLQRFVSFGCGLEIASAGEFLQALAAGCPAARIMFAGPGKREDELELVLRHGIGEIHAESRLEVERIAAISRRLRVTAPVALRVNPTEEVQGGTMLMGGKPSPFGVDEEQIDAIVDRLARDPVIDFRGIHLFSGTQILDHTVLLRQYRKGLAIARRLATRLGRPLPTVDFGGGLGIPYFSGERPLDLDKLREELAALMAEVEGDPLFAGTRFVLEPGRYLVGEAGIYVTRVTDIKVSRGKKFLIVDGGMHHHLAASGNLGQVIRRSFPVALLTRLTAPARETVDVVGPLCTPLDVLARSVTLPAADVGDLVGVFQSGAYARTASPLGFLSHPTPAEVLVEDGAARLIRRRGTYDDLLADSEATRSTRE